MKFLPKIFRIRNIFLYIIYVTNFSFSQFQVSPMLIEQYTDNDETSVSIVNISNNKKFNFSVTINYF